MTIFGIPEATIKPLIAAVSPTGGDEEDRFARAAWSCIAEPGDTVAGKLIAALGANAALEAVLGGMDCLQILETSEIQATETEVNEAIARWRPRAISSQVCTALTQAARLGITLLTPTDAHWPTGFASLGAHTPYALWLRGDATKLAALNRSICLIGARAATNYGEHVTMEIASGLVERGFAIVSGAAYGIDGMAHRATLASSGRTIAVLAGGVDRFYPSGHEDLLRRIVEAGAVASELPCGAAPTKWRFLQRNRLLASAAQATVVVEAGWRSGSLNTAGHALALGRPVGSVPGPVTSAASTGCHRLIREGAVCVTDAEQVSELVD